VLVLSAKKALANVDAEPPRVLLVLAGHFSQKRWWQACRETTRIREEFERRTSASGNALAAGTSPQRVLSRRPEVAESERAALDGGFWKAAIREFVKPYIAGLMSAAALQRDNERSRVREIMRTRYPRRRPPGGATRNLGAALRSTIKPATCSNSTLRELFDLHNDDDPSTAHAKRTLHSAVSLSHVQDPIDLHTRTVQLPGDEGRAMAERIQGLNGNSIEPLFAAPVHAIHFGFGNPFPLSLTNEPTFHLSYHA
jgi:hypothetical protein